MPPEQNGWKDFEIKRLSDGMDRIERRLRNIETEIALLRLKSGLWGAVAGVVAALGPVIFMLWKTS